MRKMKLRCVDGPLKGEILYLATPSTAVFSVKEGTGRYAAIPGLRQLKWEPHHVSRA